MGLAQPTRYIYVIQRWDPSLLNYSDLLWPWYIEETNDVVFYFIARLNFDPLTLVPTAYVNGTLYSAFVETNPSLGVNFTVPYAVNPFASTYTAVADLLLNPGELYTGLTEDDVGGLRYLLSADNVNYERLLPDVRTFGPHRGGVGNGAWRPGVEKITFVPHPFNPRHGQFLPMVNRFTDTYIVNGKTQSQLAIRVINQPDFLFCAADTGANNPFTPWVVRTGTTNWLNNAALNGNTNGEGPGVIQPPIKITFQKLGPIVITADTAYPYVQPNTYDQSWGSFDDSTNLPIVYPPNTQPNNRQMTIRLRFWVPSSTYTIGYGYN
jgi:hypothetical protein